jgi:hypothetical protein
MSYRAGIGGTMAAVLRVEPTEPCIICDGCGLRRTVYQNRNSYAPAAWLLNGKAAPGWKGGRNEDGRRTDWCRNCKANHKEEP